MLKLNLSLFFILFISITNAQQWNWANVTAGGSSVDRNIILTKGNSGDFIITGEFEQTKTFGTYTLTAVGNQDVFVAKYDQAGTCLWAIQGGGNFSINDATGISTDNSGNIYIGGNFSNQIVFGGFTLNLGNNVSSSFIAKFDQAGNCQFLNPIYSKGGSVLRHLEKDGLGNFVITGSTNDSTYFGTLGIKTAASLSVEIYVAKFDATGNFIWVKTAGGNGYDVGYKLSSDVTGNIYLGGYFEQTATFGTNSAISFGNADMFVTKYDSNGANKWVKNAGATGIDKTYGLSNDAFGNTYATGYYYPTPVGMSTSPAHFGPFLLADNGAGNMFICKFDSVGNFVWANKGGGTQHDEGYDISTDVNGNSYVTGVFEGTANFGAITGFSGFNLVSTGAGDAFIVKYNAAGKGLFAQKIGGTNADFGKSVLSYSNGDCIIAGNFSSSSVTVNTVPPTVLTSPGGFRVFLVKYAGGSVGISESENENRIIGLYPNPAKESITVSILNKQSGNFRFEIVDAAGRMVAYYDNKSYAGLNDFQFDTRNLENGAYYIKINTPQSSHTKKFNVIR